MKKRCPIKFPKLVIKDLNLAFQRSVSYSQYSTWKQCPLKWYLQSVEKKKPKPSIHMVFGTAIHQTLQAYLKMMYEKSGAEADRLPIEEIFEDFYTSEYTTQYVGNKNEHLCTREEMSEIYEDGIEILKWFKSHRKQYFGTKNTWLIGIEIPLQIEIINNVFFTGFIDLVLYDSVLEKITIYDFKTSAKGWNKWQKNDDSKLAQILLYKKYFADLYVYPVERVDVEFLVLKRKIEVTEWQEYPKRIQSIRPAAGKTKISQATQNFSEFLKECFDENGLPNVKKYEPKFSKLCEYCVFNRTSDCPESSNQS